MSADLIVEGFAGPGGWGVALDRLGLRPAVGIELEDVTALPRQVETSLLGSIQ